RRLMQIGDAAELGGNSPRLPPEEIRFERLLRDHSHRRQIRSDEAVAIAALVDCIRLNRDDRGREGIKLESLPFQGETAAVEASRRVEPVEVADQTLFAKRQLLPADADAVGRAELAVGHSKV